MSKPAINPGELNKDDLIKDILRNHSSRKKPITATEIYKLSKGRIKRQTFEGFVNRIYNVSYKNEEEIDELISGLTEESVREILFIKVEHYKNGKEYKLGYWLLETLTDSEFMFLIDSVIYSKILTQKEAKNLVKRIECMAGKNFDKSKYQYRDYMENQPYFVGDDDIDENKTYIESRVLMQVRKIREAIAAQKRVKFNLCVYHYENQKITLVPYGKSGKVLPGMKTNVVRVCSPFDVIFCNGRYYMLAADLETERKPNLKYKLYRIDLMTDLEFARGPVQLKDEAKITELNNLYDYRIKNPFMYGGEIHKVKIRVDADQFTQIVDWFSNDFRVVGQDADGTKYYDIELDVNLNSFKFWILQYSGCVEVLEWYGDKGENSYRNEIRKTLKSALEKYEKEI